MKFKIDFPGSSYYVFGVYKLKPFLIFWYRWVKLAEFTNQEEAEQFYNKIKGFPEYLP